MLLHFFSGDDEEEVDVTGPSDGRKKDRGQLVTGCIWPYIVTVYIPVHSTRTAVIFIPSCRRSGNHSATCMINQMSASSTCQPVNHLQYTVYQWS